MTTTKTALANAKNIDIHAHAVLAESMGAAGAYGPELGAQDTDKPWFRIGDYQLDGVRYQGSTFMDIDLRIQAMDKAGIGFQVLSPNPLTYFHFIPAREAVEFCYAHNNALHARALQYPQRLAAVAALPMQDIGEACSELERAVNELGMLGAYIGTDFGKPLDSPELDPLYEKLVQLNVPLFIHPAPAGIDGPVGDANLKQHDLDLLTGFAGQESIGVATLIYGGVLHRHPELDVCFSHAGGAVPMLLGRLNQAGMRRPWSPDYLRPDGAFEEYLSRLWFDDHVHDQRVLDFVVSVLGEQHMLLGTNFAGWDQHELNHDEAWLAVLTDNARRLLRV
ncbi:MAG: amidohydrolase family protein [Halioglobus sp.]